MPTVYEKCPKSVANLANEILCEHESHKPLLDARVTIDLIFASAERDEEGHIVADALKQYGIRALAIVKKLSLKDRAMGRGDAEICIDKDWWDESPDLEHKALLDHELHHLAVKTKDGAVMRDDLGRPKLEIRKHDYQFGWFKLVAERNGIHSQERIQAKAMFDDAGQYFWPDIMVTVKIA